MFAQSSALEADAGTLYPTAMHATNGNSLTITYQAGLGAMNANTSARIQEIRDPRSTTYYPTYQFGYSAGPSPHLLSISGNPSEAYRFTIGGQSVSPPFG